MTAKKQPAKPPPTHIMVRFSVGEAAATERALERDVQYRRNFGFPDDALVSQMALEAVKAARQAHHRAQQ